MSKDQLIGIIFAEYKEKKTLKSNSSYSQIFYPQASFPTIEYLIRWLVGNNVHVIFIFSTVHQQSIKKYLSKSKRENDGKLTLRVMTIDEHYTVGDIMRSLHEQRIISTNFILVLGNLITNLNICQVLHEHKKHQALNKHSIMTVVFKTGTIQQRIRLGEANRTVIVDQATNRILSYNFNETSNPSSGISILKKKKTCNYKDRFVRNWNLYLLTRGPCFILRMF
jgi:translation initiation factor eIF-2B subunit epsilon